MDCSWAYQRAGGGPSAATAGAVGGEQPQQCSSGNFDLRHVACAAVDFSLIATLRLLCADC